MHQRARGRSARSPRASGPGRRMTAMASPGAPSSSSTPPTPRPFGTPGQNDTFEVDGEYPLDFLGALEPIGTYEDLLPHAETVSVGGRPTRVIGLDDLIRIKRYLGRPKDRESLLQLEAIKRLREQEGLR